MWTHDNWQSKSRQKISQICGHTTGNPNLLTNNLPARGVSHKVGVGLHVEDHSHVVKVHVPALVLHERGNCRQVAAGHGADVVEGVGGQGPGRGRGGGSDLTAGSLSATATVDSCEVAQLGGSSCKTRRASRWKVKLV